LSDRIPFNDDDTKDGIEGWRIELDEKRIVYVSPTNSRYDWIRDFVMPRKQWFHLALWLVKYLQELPKKSTVILGYSMGGAIALNTASLMPSITKVYTFGSPKPGRIDTPDAPVVQWRTRGDIVPFLPILAPRISRSVVIDQWKPFWEAHASYGELISSVIASEGG